MSSPTPEALVSRLERSLRARQAERLPSIAAGVVRDGETIWSGAVGSADLEAGIEATPATQYRVGSITKTFTAVAVMQLRDAGKLDLDDRVEQHVPGIANGSPTLRRMLAHLSGLQREAGEMFVTGEAPGIAEILEAMAGYELVLPAARAHHYSNLAYGLLGEVVARLSGSPYTDYVDERILAPLGLTRTTWQEREPRAVGYLVDEYTGTAGREAHIETGGVAAMGQLWSTVGDLCRWGALLVGGQEGVLAPDTVEEMWAPQVMLNPDDWSVGWGLGLQLVSQEGRIFGGHGGAMPGFLAGLLVNRETKTGAAVLTNSGTRAPTGEIAIELAAAAIELWPPEIEPWKPESPPPPEIAAILGQWWSEGNEFAFSWRDGKLTATAVGAPPRIKPSVFEPLADGSFRVASGRERGERLRVEGMRIVWGGYLFTRDQEPTAG
ncbi:MAG TPA: serine hydrolase domain-containing protein [Gaiellaceae bacterium]|nr:serine hydrolase domain-containing protein [Gaiellaceae bacterium]